MEREEGKNSSKFWAPHLRPPRFAPPTPSGPTFAGLGPLPFSFFSFFFFFVHFLFVFLFIF